MQGWFLILFPIILLALTGVFVPLLYLRQMHRGKQRDTPLSDQNNSLLAALLLVAFLSVGLFFILVFSTGW